MLTNGTTYQTANQLDRFVGFTAREPVRMLAGAQATTRYAGV